MHSISTRVTAWCICLAGLATLPTLGRQPLSWNEAVTLSAAQRSPSQLWALLRHTDAPLGLYYLIIHGWLIALGWLGIEANAYWLRLPSALADIGCVAAVVLIVSRCFDDRIALVAGTVLAVHPMMTFYAQDARPYALVALSFVASTAALIAALRRPTALRLTLYGLLATLTIYLHLFSVYAFAGHAFLIVAYTSRGRRWRWLVVGAAVGVAISPLAVLASSQHGEVGWIPHPTPRILASVVTNIFGGVALLIAMLALGLAAWREKRPRSSDPRVIFLILVAAAPVLALVAVDFAVPDLVARYALVCIPAAAILVAVAAARSSPRIGRTLVAAVVAIAVITTVVQQTRPFKYENYREAADVMGDTAVPGSTVMFLPISTRAGFEPYRRLEPDLRRVADSAIAGRAIDQTDRIGGADLPPAILTQRFDHSPLIFVLGQSVPEADRDLHGPADTAQLAALKDYRIVRVLRTGDLYLSVLRPDNSAP